MKLDLTRRVLVAAIVPATAIAVALAWVFTWGRIADLDRELRDRGFAIARQLAPAVEFGVFSDNRQILGQLVDAASRETGVTGVAVLNAGGVVLASNGSHVFARWEDVLPVSATLVSDRGGTLVYAAPVGTLQILDDDLFSLQTDSSARGPIGLVLLALSRAPMELRKTELVTTAVTITVIGLLLAAFAARLLARGATEPIRRLAAVVSEIKRGNLDARAPTDAPGVLNELQTGINEMAHSLEEAHRDLQGQVDSATRELKAQMERAEAASRAKTQFLAAASHDLRQPLQAAGLFVSTMRLRNRSAEMGELIDYTDRALMNVNNVLEALLDISRLDAGAIEPDVAAFPVANVLQAVQEGIDALAAQASIDLRVHPSRAWCRSDSRLLERILSNLAANAVQHAGGRRVLLACRVHRDVLRIEVRDDGVGIAPERQQDIFREFVQVGESGEPRNRGLGLGLAIVDRLARLLGHAIEVRSAPGRGSTFTVIVPRAAPAAAPAEARASAPPRAAAEQLRGLSVLLIDDDDALLNALGRLLAVHGASALPAHSEDEVEALLHDGETPQLIISDYRLGEVGNGVRLITRLREHYGVEAPAIILTGDMAPEVQRDVAAAGLPLLNKPVRMEALLATLAQLLPKRTPAAD